MTQATPSGAVHPVAALFPLLAGDDLDDLVQDIREHGLLRPIVLDASGQTLDGRNRLTACERAGVEPRFEVYDGDAVAYIISANIHRRHLSAGQRAMLVARARIETIRTTRTAARVAGVSHGLVSHANVVLNYAPELVDQVIAGGSLDDAYTIASTRHSQAQQFARIRQEHDIGDLGERVDRGDLTPAEALEQINVLSQLEAARARTRALQNEITLMVEQIGPETRIVQPPELRVDRLAPPRDPAPAQAEALAAQERLLQRLSQIRRSLADLAADTPTRDGYWTEGTVMAVRAAVSQIVASAYEIAAAHNALLESPGLRRVR